MHIRLIWLPALLFWNIALADGTPVRPSAVAEVYSYGCKFNFLEGEGVTESSVSCIPGQNLGMYQAEYRFYLFQHSRGSNFHRRGTSDLYPNLCGLRLERFACESGELKLEFGLSAVRDRNFPIAVSLYPAPQMPGQVVGFAAPLNQRGECSEGLVKIRPFFAYPASMISPLPSNFINRNGMLNAVQVTTILPEPFALVRTPAGIPCDSTGRCTYPSGESYLASESPFIAASPVVCGIAPEDIQ